jgi:uncharacterized protein
MASDQPTNEEIRDFVIAGHGNLTKVQEMLAARPDLLYVAHEWRPGDTETALQGAAHVGNRAIAEYLLAQGAPLEITTAAMLGKREEVEEFLRNDASKINATGAHSISLLSHAALSGDVALVQGLFARGANTGASFALSLAVSRNDLAMARWLLNNAAPDLAWKNFQDKTVMEIAQESNMEEMAALLAGHVNSA